MIKNLTLFLSLTAILLYGCEQTPITIKPIAKKSEFKVNKHYSQFSEKMENNDTLLIGVGLSVCMWEEFDLVEITKTNDSVFIEIKEKYVMDDPVLHFPKVHYYVNNDSLKLETMMREIDIKYQERHTGSFFTIINPKDRDTVRLRSTNLIDQNMKIEKYRNIISELYPEEMSKYSVNYLIPKPKPVEN